MQITVLDFTAKWCGPCRTLTPLLHAVATEYRGDVAVTEIDVDDDPVSAQRYDVRAMPTLVLVRDGREVGRVVGVRNRAYLQRMLDRATTGDVAIV
ncbi:MAG TPA: thioredoxin family protein [Kofleriaceae bacterium]|jgi:thioredoxin 1